MRSSSWKWWVCGLLLLATTLNYMDRLTLNLLSGRIMGEFQLDARRYGSLESVFGNAFAVGAIIFGWMADRWNVRWIYPAAVVAWSIAGFATGLADGFMTLLLCRFCLGLAESGNWPCALRTTQHILPSGQRGLGNGILQSGAAIGAVVTPLVILALVIEGNPQHYPEWVAGTVGRFSGGTQSDIFFPAVVSTVLTPAYRPGAWRWPFVVIGAFGISWGALWLLSVRRADLLLHRRVSPSLIGIVGWLIGLISLDFALKVTQFYAPSLESPWLSLAVAALVCILGTAAVARWLFRATAADSDGEPLSRIDFVRRFWILLVLVVTINGLWHFFRAWMPLFLQRQHDFSEKSVNGFTTVYYLATAVGSLTTGFASLLLVRRGLSVHASRVAIFGICAVLTTLSIVAALVPRNGAWLGIGSDWILMGLLLVIGFAALGLFPIYYSLSQELTTRHQGKVTGALGCITWLVMAFLHVGVGEFVKAKNSYSLGVGLAGLAPLVGLVVLWLFWGKSTVQAASADDGEPVVVKSSANRINR
jgi:ACS family hexuronate transporter-like MFS transporter